jgi:hypothetical protein
MPGRVIQAQRRIDGMYGEVWVDGVWWSDVVDINGTITVERKPINPAGTVQTFNKRGRVSREGTMRFDKTDSRLEKLFLESVNRDLATRRANRNTPWFSRFNTLVKLDDPDAWGAESITLMDCEIWTLPVGFNLAELKTIEIQFTWIREDVANSKWITDPGTD